MKLASLCAAGAVTVLVALAAAVHAQPAAPAPAAAPSCKAYAGGKCCDPEVAQHLTKEAVIAACGESEATYLGEKAGKDTCRYIFKTDKGEGFVEVYRPNQKEVPSAPSDPFFAWKKVGKVFVTDRALSPKSAPMLAAATGLWMPGQGFFVSVNAESKVCSKPEAQKLAKALH